MAAAPLNFHRSAEPVEARLKGQRNAERRPSTGSGLRYLFEGYR